MANSRSEQKRRAVVAAKALRSSVLFSSEIIGIIELLEQSVPLSALNKTATMATMRGRIDDMTAFIEELETGIKT